MSWLKENYEKAALGGAAVIALSVGALIFTGNAGEVTDEKNPKKVNTFDVPEKVSLAGYSDALGKTGTVNIAKHLGEDLYSFIAYPVYGVKGVEGLEELGPEKELNGAPLKWWKKHGMDDWQFSGADTKDNDNDGFNNIEEFVAKTSPVDDKSHPDLITKLEFVSSKKTPFRMQWSTVDENRANMTFTHRRTSFDICAVGDTFPKGGQTEQFLNRFKVKAKGEGKNPTTGIQEGFYEIEDTKKAGMVYKMWRSDGPKKFQDWSVTLKLNTPNGGANFVVTEGGEFSLPFKEGGKGYTFVLDAKRDPKQAKLTNLNIKTSTGVVPLGIAAP